MDQPTTESFTELEEVAEEQEMSPAGTKHDHIVDGEDMVVLDDASEAERTETLDIDHQISTTSEDVLGGIGGEGAELHPEYDDFDVDDQHFEVLETADGDFSGESHDLEQSPNLDDSLSEKKDRERESGKRERSSYEKSGSYSLHCHRVFFCVYSVPFQMSAFRSYDFRSRSTHLLRPLPVGSHLYHVIVKFSAITP